MNRDFIGSKFTITSEDFINSNYNNPKDCSLAKAVKRDLPDNKISVGFNYVRIDGKCYGISLYDANEIYSRTTQSSDITPEPLTITLINSYMDGEIDVS